MKARLLAASILLGLAAFIIYNLQDRSGTTEPETPLEGRPRARRVREPAAEERPQPPSKAAAPKPAPKTENASSASESARILRAELRYVCGRPVALSPGLVLYRPGAAPLKGKGEGLRVSWSLPEGVGGRYALYTDFEIGRRRAGGESFIKKKSRHPYLSFAQGRPSIDLGAALPKLWPVTLKLEAEPQELLIAVTREGKPAVGARLRTTPQPYAPFFRSGARDLFLGAETDAAGQARLWLPAYPRLDIAARLEELRGRASVKEPFPARVAIELAPPLRREDDPELCHLRLLILDAEGAAVTQAEVSLELIEAIPEAAPPRGYLVSRADSRLFRKPELHFRGKLGRYRGAVETASSLTPFEVLIDRRGVLIEERVQLRALPSLSGTVLGPEGAPIAGARLALSMMEQRDFAPQEGSPRRYRSMASSDSAGGFTLPSRKPRESWLLVYKEGFASAALDLRGREDPVVVTLRRGARLYGRLLDAGNAPLKKTRLRLGCAGKRRWGTTDEEGRFRFLGLPREGALSLGVSATETSPAVTFTAALQRDRELVLMVPQGERLELRLRRGEDLLNGREARVRLLSLEPDQSRAPQGMSWSRHGPRVRVEKGIASIDGLAPGLYLLEAFASIEEEELEVSYAGPLRLPRGPLTIELEASARLELSAPEGAELRVELLPQAATRLSMEQRRARNIWWYYGSCHRDCLDPGRSRRIGPTPPGVYRLSWGPKGGPARSQELVLAPGEERSLRLGD